MEWNKENTLYFIQLIKERPVIWDVSSSDHKMKNKKQDAIEEISNIFGITAKEVLAKWTSLRGQYNREKKKVTGLKTGSGAADIYISKWFAYEEMSNMLCFNIPQNSVSNLEDNMILSLLATRTLPPATPTPPPATPTPPPATPTPPPATPTPPPATPTPPSATPTPPPAMPTPPPAMPTPATTALPPPSKFPIKKRNRNTAIYSEAMSTLKAIKERQSSGAHLHDEIDSFGVYVAAQLRKFRPVQQSKLKLDIQTLFYNCEVGDLDLRSNASSSGYSDYCCELQSPESPMTTGLNDTESNTSMYGQSDMQQVQSMQPSIQIAGTSVCVQPDLQQPKPMQSSPSDNAMSTYYPLNKVICISNDGSLIRSSSSKPSQVINNSTDLPAVFILDNKTIVRPGTSYSSAQMETTEESDQETNECFLKFNK